MESPWTKPRAYIIHMDSRMTRQMSYFAAARAQYEFQAHLAKLANHPSK